MTKTPDFFLDDHGSVWLLRPENEFATGWIDENLPKDRMYMGNAVAVEARYVEQIWLGLLSEGFTVNHVPEDDDA